MRSAKPGLKAGRVAWLGVCDLAGEGPKLMRTAVRPMRARAHLSIKSLRPNGAARRDPPRGMTRKSASASFNRGLSRRQRRRKIATMLFLKQSLPGGATRLSRVLAATGDPLGCEKKRFAFARVARKAPRFHFIAGKSERMPACPSAESACRLKAYVVPGDEVLVEATEAPYLCAL